MTELENTPEVQDSSALDSLVASENQEAQEVASQEPIKSEQPVENETVAQGFKRIREAKEKAERERDDLMRRVQDLENRSYQQKPAQQAAAEDDEDINLGPDDLAEGKHLTKVGRKIKKLEEQLKQYQQQSAAVTTEARLKSQYPDFDRVVNKDTIEQFKYMHPELAATLNSSTDLYSTAVSAYKLIKQFGIYQEDNYSSDKERIQQNTKKPRSSASVLPQQGESPLAHADLYKGELTDDRKKQIYADMIKNIRTNV